MFVFKNLILFAYKSKMHNKLIDVDTKNNIK